MTSCGPFIVTPSNDNTFGWRRVLYVMNSLQNLYVGHDQLISAKFSTPSEGRTFDILPRSFVKYILTTLAAAGRT